MELNEPPVRYVITAWASRYVSLFNCLRCLMVCMSTFQMTYKHIICVDVGFLFEDLANELNIIRVECFYRLRFGGFIYLLVQDI